MNFIKILSALSLFSIHLLAAQYQVDGSNVAAFNSKTLSPDDNIVLNGVVSTPIVVHDSGAIGHPITITFAPGAKLSKGSWYQSGANGDAAIYLNGKSYIVIDGSGTGIIECTSNGTGLKTSDDCLGIYGLGNCSNITIKNLTIRTIYMRTFGADTQKGNNIKFDNWTGSNIMIDNCTLSDSASLISCAYGKGASGFEVANSRGTNQGIGCVVIGDRQDYATISGISIHDNNFSMTLAWSGSSSIHKNLIYCYANNAADHSTMTGTQIYGNVFSGYMGGNATSYVYIDGWNYSPRVWNNIFSPSAKDFSGNGFITIKGTSNATITNNTFVGQGDGIAIGTTGSGGVLGTGLKISGATMTNIFTPIYDQVKMWSTAGSSIDGNTYILASTFYAGTGADTFTQWQSETGMDRNSKTSIVIPPVIPPVVPPVIPPSNAKVKTSVSSVSADGKIITTIVTLE